MKTTIKPFRKLKVKDNMEIETQNGAYIRFNNCPLFNKDEQDLIWLMADYLAQVPNALEDFKYGWWGGLPDGMLNILKSKIRTDS